MESVTPPKLYPVKERLGQPKLLQSNGNTGDMDELLKLFLGLSL